MGALGGGVLSWLLPLVSVCVCECVVGFVLGQLVTESV